MRAEVKEDDVARRDKYVCVCIVMNTNKRA